MANVDVCNVGRLSYPEAIVIRALQGVAELFLLRNPRPDSVRDLLHSLGIGSLVYLNM